MHTRPQSPIFPGHADPHEGYLEDLSTSSCGVGKELTTHLAPHTLPCLCSQHCHTLPVASHFSCWALSELGAGPRFPSIRLIKVGRTTLVVGVTIRGVESGTTQEEESNLRTSIQLYLLPGCRCDVTSCLGILALRFPF